MFCKNNKQTVTIKWFLCISYIAKQNNNLNSILNCVIMSFKVKHRSPYQPDCHINLYFYGKVTGDFTLACH